MSGSPSEKQYYSVDTSEELGIVNNASRHTAMTDIDSDTMVDFDDVGASCVSKTCTALTDYLRSYRAAEFIICLAFFLVTNTASSWLHISPYQRPIPAQYLQGSGEYVIDLTHNSEFDGETVPYSMLILLSGVLPLILQVLLSLGARRTCPIHEVHRTLCVYFCAWSLNMIACEFVKNYVGYLRPLFFQYCEPNEDYTACLNGDENSLRKSFPSGHSSTAFCGMTLLALYIHNRYGVHSKRRYRPVQQPKGSAAAVTFELYYENDASMPLARLMSVMALVPLFVALWIAASRVRDNKHFPADVVAGALIGSTLAAYSHGMWFV